MQLIQIIRNPWRKSLLIGVIALWSVLRFLQLDPYTEHLESRFLPLLTNQFIGGTDNLGRDLFARIIWGIGYSSLSISIILTTSLFIAIPLGLLSARSKFVNAIASTLAGVIWSIPTIIVGLIIFSSYKGQMIALKFLFLGMFNWVPIFRALRDITYQIQQSTFILHSRSMGYSDVQIYSKLVLPNSLIATFPTILLNIIGLLEADFILSYLGFSFPEPQPTLGSILNQGISNLNMTMILIPSFVYTLIILSIVSIYFQLNKAHGLNG